MPIRKITIAGCGLIGGSLGAALRTQVLPARLPASTSPRSWTRHCAWARSKWRSRRWKRRSGCRSRSAGDTHLFDPGASSRRRAPFPCARLITDTGSTKAEIVAAAKALFGTSAAQRFLAGHPIAGKERSGIEQADPICSAAPSGCSRQYRPQQTQHRHAWCPTSAQRRWR